MQNFLVVGRFVQEIRVGGPGFESDLKIMAERRVEMARQAKCGPENVVLSCWKVFILLLSTNSI